MPKDNMITMRSADFEDILEIAAEKGATSALKKVGLDDEWAGKDIMDLRVLLKSWRLSKRTALQTVIRVSTTALLGALIVGVAVKMKFIGH